MRAEWVTFDCYGTLIDWESGIRSFFQSLDRGANAPSLMAEWEEIQFAMIQGPHRKYREIMAQSLRETMESSGRSYSAETGARFAEAMTQWKPFPDTNPALQRLRAQGLKLGIISNTDDDLLERTVRHFSVPFDLLVTAEQSGAYKPDTASFGLALRRIGRPPGQVTHVAFGDRYDLATARQCGMQVVFVNRHRKSIAFRADAEIPSLADLPALFDPC